MKRLQIPTNTTRLASAVAVKTARAGVITHRVVKPNLMAGTFAKLYHPSTKV